MHPTIERLLSDKPYDRLPESIKLVISEHEYNWMSDSQKANLEQTETEPEIDL